MPEHRVECIEVPKADFAEIHLAAGQAGRRCKKVAPRRECALALPYGEEALHERGVLDRVAKKMREIRRLALEEGHAGHQDQIAHGDRQSCPLLEQLRVDEDWRTMA